MSAATCKHDNARLITSRYTLLNLCNSRIHLLNYSCGRTCYACELITTSDHYEATNFAFFLFDDPVSPLSLRLCLFFSFALTSAASTSM